MGEEESGWKGAGKKGFIGEVDREGRLEEEAQEPEHRANILKGAWSLEM